LRYTYHINSLLDYQGLIGRSSGYIEGLSNDIKKTIEGLKGVDAEYLAIFNQFKKESLELEAKVCSCVQSDKKTLTKTTSLYFSSSPVSHERSTRPSTRLSLHAAPSSSRVSKSQQMRVSPRASK